MPEERSLYLFASVLSAAIFGVEVCPVQVEADVSNGLPSFIMVGFPSAQVKEAQERVRTALKNNGYQFPPKRITVNFAPADMKKEGAGFDVPVAAAVLAASISRINRIITIIRSFISLFFFLFRFCFPLFVTDKSASPLLFLVRYLFFSIPAIGTEFTW